jgi:hypothetical protein
MLAGEVSIRTVEPQGEADDNVVPPISVCVICGLTACQGCRPAPGVVRSSLAWEDSDQPWWTRLWRTALASSLEPRRFFGEMPVGRLSEAFVFATCAEVFALGSLAVAAALCLWLVAPELTRQVLSNSAACKILLVSWVAFVICMLGLHAVWGACLAWGARLPTPRRDGLALGRWRSGVRFGLYACGWDLLTSPVGILATLVTRGPLRAWAPLGAAARAPSLAQRAYLELCLGADALAQRRAQRLSVYALSGGMLLVLALFVAAMVSLARRFGY